MFALIAAASLFYTVPCPLDMPKAAAFLSSSGKNEYRLKDKYDKFDLWTLRSVLGRWEDEDYRTFTVFKLDKAPPQVNDSTQVTREEYAALERAMDTRDDKTRKYALSLLSPIELSEKPQHRRAKLHGYRDVEYYEGTNETVIVAAFLPEKSRTWYAASWELQKGDDIAQKRKEFEEVFLKTEFASLKKDFVAAGNDERSLIREDIHQSVANYDSWKYLDNEEYTALYEVNTDFVKALMKSLPELEASFKKALPAPVELDNTLSILRIFDSREKYLLSVGEDKEWTAAFWAQDRRELVAYLPRQGEAELMKTLRHELFHQYLSYSCSMIASSPWLNEGYAQYFEDPRREMKWDFVQKPEDLAEAIIPMLFMNYEEFYEGDEKVRNFKYRLALSIVDFLEKGAPQVRGKPFKDLKRDYLRALIETRDMRKATLKAFGNRENLDRFICEYVRFYNVLSGN